MVLYWMELDFSGRASFKIIFPPPFSFQIQILDSSPGTCGEYPPGAITPRMLCAHRPHPTRPGDACRGDSGGPLVAAAGSFRRRNTLLGVVSFGRGCAQPR